jgi:putative hydrolase of HD superfamily
MTDIDFLLKALKLKDEKRTGWELRNIEDPESVADHSWSAAFLTLVCGMKEENIDTDRAIKIALVHDLAEADTGDIATRAQDADQDTSEEVKNKLEHSFFDNLTETLEDDGIRALWKEYEQKETDEAKFAKDMDKIELCLQALKYELKQRYDPEEDNENFQEYDNLDEFFATTKPRLNTETGKQLFQEIRQRYEDAKKE